MSEFLGARISLISKSDIRYSGVLHDISSEDSTVSLENVISYGTEGRRGKPEDEIPPADQIYEYIVFRGSDVKDLRIEETPAVKPFAPAVPNDPAILGARPLPGNSNAPPQFQQGPPPGPPPGPPQQGGPGFVPNMPLHHNAGGWGPNGPSPRNLPYPPPPGWYPPQGPGFGPAGPQWNNNFYPPGPQQQHPFAPGPPVANNGGRPPQPQQPQQPAEKRPSPVGASEKQPGPAQGPAELEPKSLSHPPVQPVSAGNKPAPTGPSADIKKPAPPSAPTSKNGPAEAAPALPTGPKNTTRIAPIVPLPAGLVNKTVTQTAVITSKQTGDASTLRDATQAAKAAVAVAMAKLEGGSAATAPAPPSGPSAQQGQYSNGSSAMDNLTRKVNEMRVNAAHTGAPSNNAYPRGRGRGNYGGQTGHRAPKVEVPDAEYDFASANAKFNKEDVVKEAAAGSSLEPEAPPVAAVASTGASDTGAAEADPSDPAAYNKTRSFFDNISSEAKDRAASSGQKAGGREWRGEEQRKNMETFGQGSVDGGYRGYRGRGRGRGRGGYGRGRGGYRRNNDYPQQQQQGAPQ